MAHRSSMSLILLLWATQDLAVSRAWPRAIEIREWLAAHPTCAWVALDDLNLLAEPPQGGSSSSEEEDAKDTAPAPSKQADEDVCKASYAFMRGHFVQTDGAVGLTRADAEAALCMLQAGDGKCNEKSDFHDVDNIYTKL